MFRKSTYNFDPKVKFNLGSIDKGHHRVTYRGVNTKKCPFDYVIYQMIFFELQPDLIIEIGTNEGGSALYFADLFDILKKGEIHTIDILDKCHPLAKENPRIRRFLDGWEGYDLDLAQGFDKILIIEDGPHTYQDTLGILDRFAHLISLGSYFIIEDGIIDKLGLTREYNGGPQRAIKEFLNRMDSFEIDRKWCDFFGKNTTFNVNGYLKKVR